MPTYLIIILSVIGIIAIVFGIMIFRFKKKITNYDFKNDSKKIIILNDNTFYHKISNDIALVDFWAEWCQPCKIQSPIVSEIAEEMSDKIKICKLDVEKNKKVPSKLNIRNIPTVILFKNGKEVERFVGIKTKNTLKKSISKHLTI